jgi:hypothetical protein
VTGFYGILEAVPSRDGGRWLVQRSRDQALMVLTLLEVFSPVNVQGVQSAAAAVFILWTLTWSR